MLSFSPDLGECSSTEEGVSLVAAMASPEGEAFPDEAVGSRFSPLLVHSSSAPKVNVKLEDSSSVTSSGSSALSPTTAVLMCQESITAVVLEDERPLLVRSASVSSISSPSLDLGVEDVGSVAEVGDALGNASGAVDGFIEGVGERGGDALIFYGSEVDASGAVMVVRGVAAHGSGGAPSTIEAGKVLILVVVPDIFPLLACDTIVLPVNYPLPVGSSLNVSGGSFSASPIPLIGGSMGHIGDGTVSEEGRVVPVAREALRSQPTDGLRKPPSSPVEPVIVAEGGGSQDVSGLSKIASAIGIPLYLDRQTASGSRLAFTRVCVENDASEDFINEIPVTLGTSSCIVRLRYPWLPPRCGVCLAFGHETSSCASCYSTVPDARVPTASVHWGSYLSASAVPGSSLMPHMVVRGTPSPSSGSRSQPLAPKGSERTEGGGGLEGRGRSHDRKGRVSRECSVPRQLRVPRSRSLSSGLSPGTG
ncbi:hypothetical protein Dimus_010671 [Dionaea muscipula]